MLRKAFILLICSITIRSAYGQWELIGKEAPAFGQLTKVGSALYGKANHHFYRSIDDGETWTLLDAGVPKIDEHQYVFLYSRYDGFDISLPAEFGYSYPFGFYVLHPDAKEWKFYDRTSSGRLYSKSTLRISQDSFVVRVPNEVEQGNVDSTRLYFSSDHGVTWQMRNPEGAQQFPVNPFYSDGRVFATVRIDSHYTLFHTDDFGSTWAVNSINALLDSGRSASVIAALPSVVIARSGLNNSAIYYRSTDRGATWQIMQGFSESGTIYQQYTSIDTSVVVSFYRYEKDSLIAMMQISNDSGLTWKPLTTGEGEDIIWITKRTVTDHGYLAQLVDKGELYFSYLDADLLKLSTPAFKGLAHPMYNLVHVTDSALYATSYEHYTTRGFDTFIVSLDKGKTWQHQPVADYLLDGSQWTHGRTYQYTQAYTTEYREALLRTSDLGKTWENIKPDSMYSSYIIANAGDTIGTSTSRGFFISQDGGTTWSEWATKGTFHQGLLYGADLIDTFTCRIKRSSDLGGNWSSIATFPVPVPMVYGNLYSVDSVLFLVFVTSRQDSLGAYFLLNYIYRSGDQGSTWNDISDQFKYPGEDTHIQRYDGSIYLLNEVDRNSPTSDLQPHLYVSHDGGVNWSSVPANIPPVNRMFITDAEIFLSSSYGIYRASRQRAHVSDYNRSADEPLALFPNPAQDVVSLSFARPVPSKLLLSVTDISGRAVIKKTVYSSELLNMTVKLDTRMLAVGSYLVSVEGDTYFSTAPLEIIR